MYNTLFYLIYIHIIFLYELQYLLGFGLLLGGFRVDFATGYLFGDSDVTQKQPLVS